jgi:hypothetical protein
VRGRQLDARQRDRTEAQTERKVGPERIAQVDGSAGSAPRLFERRDDDLLHFGHLQRMH